MCQLLHLHSTRHPFMLSSGSSVDLKLCNPLSSAKKREDFDHNTPLVHTPHLLPVHESHRLSVFCHRCIISISAPTYLCNCSLLEIVHSILDTPFIVQHFCSQDPSYRTIICCTVNLHWILLQEVESVSPSTATNTWTGLNVCCKLICLTKSDKCPSNTISCHHFSQYHICVYMHLYVS